MAKNAVLQVRGPMAAGSEACTSTSPPQVPWHLLFWSTRRKMEAASEALVLEKICRMLDAVEEHDFRHRTSFLLV